MRSYTVKLLPLAHEVVAPVGPFVVQAKSEQGAFRIVRNGWPHWLTDHVQCELREMVCNGVVSDRRGKRLAFRADKRSAYDGRFPALSK